MKESTNPRALSQSVIHSLIEELRNGRYKNLLRLPPEDALAKEFGVSRSMMRECLTELERAGLISRQKGVGTIINRRIVNVANRLDLVSSIDPILTRLGYETATPYVNTYVGTAEGEVATALELPPGTAVLTSERVITINGNPGVHLVDYVPMHFLSKRNYGNADVASSIFDFLQEDAGLSLNLFLSELRAVALPKEIADHLKMPVGAPILYLAELGFDIKNRPILYSSEYLVDRVIHQMIIRKPI